MYPMLKRPDTQNLEIQAITERNVIIAIPPNQKQDTREGEVEMFIFK